jgi:GNAT superfamily N-acetyltransferase
VRTAVRADIGALSALIDESTRVLHRNDYTPRQVELALEHVYGVDSALIDDETYYIIESGGEIAAAGGWSKRAALCGGDQFGAGRDGLLDPASDAAKIRAFYVRPAQARRGLASVLLETCERRAAAAGFCRAELGATLTGARFYAARGYTATGRADIALPDGERLAVVRMERAIP